MRFFQALLGFVFGAVLFHSATAYGQADLKLLREIRLPVAAERGSFGTGFWLVGTPAKELFAASLAPDQSLLVLDPDNSGSWPLLRIRQWWTPNPSIDSLNIPGWNSTDAKDMDMELVDLQVTPDGHYAVAIFGAGWMRKGEGYIFLPRHYVPRPSEGVLTLVDLHRWRIIGSVRTTDIGIGFVTAARILDSGWIAVQGSISGTDRQSNSRSDLLDRTRLLKLPGLEPGLSCVAQFNIPFGGHLSWQKTNQANDASCRQLLKRTGLASYRELESRIFFARDLEPAPIRLHRFQNSQIFSPSNNSRDQIIDFAEPIWRYPFRTEDFRDEIYFDNLPYQSGGLWYGLYESPDHGFYSLGRFDSAGNLQMEQTVHSLACGDRSFAGKSSACGCRIEDAASHLLLAYCRTQHGDFSGWIQHQWLTVFRSDSLTPVGAISLYKRDSTAQLLGVGDGHPYVLTVDEGNTLHVYAIPLPQQKAETPAP